MKYKHKNINEPLNVLIQFGDSYCGESFSLVFFAGKNKLAKFVCKYDAESGTYSNCEKVDDKAIVCFIPPRKIGTGILFVTKNVTLEDWSQSGAKQTLSETTEVVVNLGGYDFGIEMSTALTDHFTPSAITTQILPLITRGKPGKTVWAELSEEEKKEVAALLGNILTGNKAKSTSADNGYATPSRHGIIRVGEGLMITDEGTLSIDINFMIQNFACKCKKNNTVIKSEI